MPSRRRSRRTRRISLPTLLVIVLAVAIWVYLYGPEGTSSEAGDGWFPPGPSAAASDAPVHRAPIDPATLDPDLAALVVAGPSSTSPYDRELFGAAWADVDGNGCDTRNDVLIRDLVDLVFRADSNGCIVRTGTLHDPYTGAVISFTRGPDTSEAVQIDHMVPLSYAWQHGASTWTDAQRAAFANDPANLSAVDGPANQSKSDSGPAEWMPPRGEYACTYVDRFAGVLLAYGLTIAPEDLDAIAAVDAGCPA
ncbi:HNH endonuclease family protein [Agromyces allii]|uniref:GmrSD restriction endonucleases C-terminal domain-containing protein n=1 Tax=Agromyces allii TaxID=393607 RepID=A0ABP5BKG4_9MICO|nr:HNH endonuclease family protein [Agromyces allii]